MTLWLDACNVEAAAYDVIVKGAVRQELEVPR